MGITRCTTIDDDPDGIAYEHTGHLVPLVGDWRLWFASTAGDVEHLVAPEEIGAAYTTAVMTNDPGPGTRVRTVGGRPHWEITGWRMGCRCGWRGTPIARDEAPGEPAYSPEGWPPPYVDGYGEAQWDAHVDQVLAAHYPARRDVKAAS